MRLVFVHSPYLGPASWQPTADELSAAGHAVQVPDLRVRREPVAASFIAAARDATNCAAGESLVLVGHSRAGPLLPAVAHSRDGSVAAVVYVDAALPHPGRSWADQASPDRAATMRRLGRSGWLPPWTDWWDPALLSTLIPDPVARERMSNDAPRLPSGFLDERMPGLDWPGPSGYLRLSSDYASFADAARVAGSLVEERNLDHLAIFTRPAEVASAIDVILTRLGSAAAT